MYRLKEDYLDFFKDIRTNSYARIIGIDYTYISSILNANKGCSEIIAKALLSTRVGVSFKEEEEMNTYLEKYFAKEK